MIDVLVVPSLWEGTPRIIIEAAGVGVPSIATKVGGIPETIKDRITGILVPCMDPVALRDAIEYLGENRKEIERLGKNAREFVECEWEVKRSVSLLADTYLEVIGSSSAARGTSSATNGFQD
jgi:glycosyltransferase involved in cell wall biosynthesis